jgi:hypothetical protein
MITGHTFRGNAYVSFQKKVFVVKAHRYEFGSYPDRITASEAAALVNKMKEKGETLEAMRKKVYMEHGNKKKALRTGIGIPRRNILKTKYARELQWVAGHTFLKSVEKIKK